MATARRVSQLAKEEGGVTHISDRLISVHDETGKPTTYEILAETHDVRDDRRVVPQPDRILLDMSIEEAQAVCAVLGRVAGGYYRQLTEGVWVQLRQVKAGVNSDDLGLTGRLEFPFTTSSSTKGTDPSTSKDAPTKSRPPLAYKTQYER